jgi:CDP-paratose 2-epimerase
MRAHDHIGQLSGQAFNIGGGAANTTSLLELIELIGQLLGERPSYRLDGWRRADQRYYVSDIRRFQAATGWAPKVSLLTGIERLATWLLEHQTPAHRPPLVAAQRVAS